MSEDTAENVAPCADCGHIHTPQGCAGDPTPSDLWAGVSVETCDCIPIEDLEPDEYCDPDWRDPITRPIPPAKPCLTCGVPMVWTREDGYWCDTCVTPPAEPHAEGGEQ